MNRSYIFKRFIVLTLATAISLTGIPAATAAVKYIYFKNCSSSGWDVDVWVIDMDNGADGYEKYLSPGEEVTITCEDDEKCEVSAAVGLDSWDMGYVEQSDTSGAQFFIRTVNKFLHVDLYYDTTGNVCYEDY
ncbi:MAG: hypothetical protein MI802_15700 [Desulfobacterales bacterium]|nr:hypothetical protein [Desulfobacterales bacterium]